MLTSRTKFKVFTPFSLAAVLAATACGGESQESEASEESFGDEPITILVSSSVGSSVDVMARAVAEGLEEEISSTVSIQNLEGGGGEVALQRLVDSEPDGTTLYAMTQSQAILFATEQMSGIEPDDLDFIARLQEDPFVWAVDSSSDIQTLQDLASTDAAPSVGGFGAMSSHTFAAANIGEELGLDFDWASFDGGEDAVTAVLGGHLDVINTNPGIVREYQEDEMLRVLAVSTEDQLSSLPDVPTFIDEGVDYVGSNWRGIVAPTGIPEDTQADLASALSSAFENDDFQELMETQGVTPSYLELEEFESFVASDIEDLEATTGLLDD